VSKLSLHTRADLEKLTEECVELICGHIVMAPAPVPWHNELVRRLVFALVDWTGREAGGRVQFAPFDVALDNFNVYQPDVLVLPSGSQPTCVDWEAPTPIWVAEVISPGTASHDRRKLPHYARKGVEEAWLVYPRSERVEIHALQTGTVTECRRGEHAKSSVLAGFRLDFEQLFHAAPERG